MAKTPNFLGKLGSGEFVVDRERSHIHAGISELLRTTLSQIRSDNLPSITTEVKSPDVIGQSSCVVTKQQDCIVYAQRPHRNQSTRFVQNRQPEPCQHLTVVLVKVMDQLLPTYKLITAYVGRLAETEPWDTGWNQQSMDPVIRERAIRFWQTHALVWGEEPIIPYTITDHCPWMIACPHCQEVVPGDSFEECISCKRLGCYRCLVKQIGNSQRRRLHVCC